MPGIGGIGPLKCVLYLFMQRIEKWQGSLLGCVSPTLSVLPAFLNRIQCQFHRQTRLKQ